MLYISKNRCVGCGICQSECPSEAIAVDTNLGTAVIDYEECSECGICVENCSQNAVKDVHERLIFAIGSDDGEKIKQNDHFGMSKLFNIYQFIDGEMVFQDQRKNAKYEEDESRTHGDPNKAKATASVLGGVDVLVGKIMGPNIVRLKKNFVPVIVREPEISKALELLTENIVEISDEYEKSERKGLIAQ